MKEKLPVSPGAPWQSGMLPGWRSRGLWLLLVLLALLTAAGLLGLDLGTAKFVQAHEPAGLRSLSVVLSLIGALCISATVSVVLLIRFWRVRRDSPIWRASAWLLPCN